jgi:hypothetical protein
MIAPSENLNLSKKKLREIINEVYEQSGTTGDFGEFLFEKLELGDWIDDIPQTPEEMAEKLVEEIGGQNE